MGWVARIVLGLLGLTVVGLVIAGYYGSTLQPPLHTYEETIANDRFPT
jgi:hypothetical protein